MEQAGFRDIEAKVFDSWLDVESGEELWQTIMAGAPAIAGMMRDVPEQYRRAVREDLVQVIRERTGRDGMGRLTMAFNIGVGAK